MIAPIPAETNLELTWRRTPRTPVCFLTFLFALTAGLSADQFETPWVEPAGQVETGVGLAPLWVYRADGLFYSGFPCRWTSVPNLLFGVGLGRGFEVGVRLNPVTGPALRIKYGLPGNAAGAIVGQVAYQRGLASSVDQYGYELGVLSTLAAGDKVGLCWMGSLGYGLARDPVGADSSGRGAVSLIGGITLPIRLGSDGSWYIAPALSSEGRFRPIVLGYEEFIGIHTPISAFGMWSLSVNVGYAAR